MRSKKILLVDDDDDLREAMSNALERRGFEIAVRADGKQALALLVAEKFDLAVLDLKMPNLGGIDVLASLRTRNVSIPVIILTGHGGMSEAVAGIHLGIVDFINKPVAPDRLAERIHALIHRQAALVERSVRDIVSPAHGFPSVASEAPLRDALVLFSEALGLESSNRRSGLPVIVIFNREGRFRGLAEACDLLKLLPFQHSPYACYLTGMFLAQSVLLDTLRVEALIDRDHEHRHLDIDAPLMEAVHRFVASGRCALPVFEQKAFAGVLTQGDIAREICRIVLRGEGA